MNTPVLIFEWDEANRAHIARHDVTPKEAEEVISGRPLDIELQSDEDDCEEERLLQLGETAKGRILHVVTTWRRGKVRVVSAWDAPKQDRLYYLAEMRRRHGATEDS